jgi:hypothetical protein
MVSLPAPFSETEVQWTIEEGEGGTLGEQVTKTSFGFAATTLKTKHEAGTTYRVGVKLLKVFETKEDETEKTYALNTSGAVAKTAAIVVGPGAADTITLDTGGLETLPADGTSEMTVTATLKDEYGNPLALGSKVYWHLQGGGMILQSDSETQEGEGGASIATAVLRAGGIPGLVQKLVIETDLSRREILVPNSALSFNLAAAAPQWGTTDGAATGTITLTANVNARDGTPIRWATTRGHFSQASGIVSGGQATAAVQINGSESNYGLAVFTAAVGHSIAKASVSLQNGGASFDAPRLTPPSGSAGSAGSAGSVAGLSSETVLRLNLPQWAGQSVRVTPEGIVPWQGQQSTGVGLLFADGSATPQTVSLDAQGKAQVVVKVPATLTDSGLASMRVEHLLGAGALDTAPPPLRVRIPVQVLTAAGLVTGGGAAAQAISGLVATVAPSNSAVTAEEQAEMERALFEDFQAAQSTGFVSGLLDLFPLEGGGGLQNQAAHANWRLQLAEFLDAQTGVIRQAAEAADKIHVEGGDGIQIITDMNNGQMQVLDNGNGLLMETDFGTEIMRAIRETGGSAGWVAKLEKTLGYAQSLNEL